MTACFTLEDNTGRDAKALVVLRDTYLIGMGTLSLPMSPNPERGAACLTDQPCDGPDLPSLRLFPLLRRWIRSQAPNVPSKSHQGCHVLIRDCCLAIRKHSSRV